MYAVRSRETVFDLMKATLRETTGIGKYNRGGKARAFIEVIADQYAATYSDLSSVAAGVLLRTASGKQLDDIGAMFGVYRLPALAASAEASDQNVEFYTESGTFGSLNSGNPILIPAGTRITSSLSDIEYVTPNSILLDSSLSAQYIDLVSTTNGEKSKLDSNSLDSVDFKDYTNYSANSLRVRNRYPLENGQDSETDTNFRFRISTAMMRSSGGNMLAVYSAAVAVPGVRDVRIYRYNEGIGTALMYVYGVYPDQSSALTSTVQTAVNSVLSLGEQVIVKAPDLVKFSITTDLTFTSESVIPGTFTRRTTSSTAGTATLEGAKQAIIGYFEMLDIGDTMSLDGVAAAIYGGVGSTNILTLSNGQALFDEVLIWRTLPNGREVSRKFTARTYTPKIGEYLTLKTVEIS